MTDFWTRQHAKNCACGACNLPNLLELLGEGKKRVNLIGGFLGSGKTTMVNNILSQPLNQRIDVIVKEFGSISVDDKLMSISKDRIHPFTGAAMHTDQQTMLINFLDALYGKSEQHPFDHLLIEASGAESAEQLLQIFYLPRTRDCYELGSYICVVDGEFGSLNLHEFRIAREQTAFADFLIVNKCDRVGEEELAALERELRIINPFAEIIETSFGAVDASAIIVPDSVAQLRSIDFDRQEEDTVEGFRSIAIRISEPLDMEKVNAWIRETYEQYGKKLLRGKGYFNIAGSDYRFDFQSVRTNFHAKTEEEWNPDEERESVVVFIGAELPDKEQLEAGLLACAASETERKTA